MCQTNCTCNKCTSMTLCNGCNQTQPCVEEPVPTICSSECDEMYKTKCVRHIGKISNNLGLPANFTLDQALAKIIARLNTIPPSFEGTALTDVLIDVASPYSADFTFKQNGLSDITATLDFKAQGIYTEVLTGPVTIDSDGADFKIVYDSDEIINNAFNLIQSNGNYNTIQTNDTITARAANQKIKFNLHFYTEESKLVTFKLKIDNGSGKQTLKTVTLKTSGVLGTPSYHSVSIEHMYSANAGGLLYTVEAFVDHSSSAIDVVFESGSFEVTEYTF